MYGRLRITIVTATALAALLALTTGCQHQQMAERRAQMRRENIGYVVDSIVRSEASRPARMNDTFGAIERKRRLDVENTRRNGALVQDYFDRGFRRWEERQPAYRDGIERLILHGKPENIEPTAIILFW